MRASRLLSILLTLQNKGRVSAPALAAALEVSVRTVYRDIDHLSAAGVPVWGDRGRQGGFELKEGWRTQLTGLTAGEAQALFMAGLPGPAKDLGLQDAAASVHLKLIAALPADWQRDAERAASRFHLDAVDWFRGAAPPDHLKAVAAAVWNEQKLRMRYESWTSVREREVDPLGLVLKAGVWYLVARQGRELRTFKLAAIQTLERLTEPFVRPRRFDLVAYWAEATRRFEESVYRGVATLRVSPAGLARLRRFGPLVADAADRASGAADARGWRRVTVPIESVEHAADEMLRLGAEAEVIEPEALREALRLKAERLLALYAA
jgi:predicted DNA-binding transcriptional regulator YafY